MIDVSDHSFNVMDICKDIARKKKNNFSGVASAKASLYI